MPCSLIWYKITAKGIKKIKNNEQHNNRKSRH